MKPVIFVLVILFPLFSGAQNNLCDSIFIKATSDFITEFSVPDTMIIATKEKVEDYLRKFDEQLNCSFFWENAKPLRALSYTSRYLNFGVVEMVFKEKDKAATACKYLLKKHFSNYWEAVHMLSCAMVDKEKVLFIYSFDVESPSMIDFIEQMCGLKKSV